MASLGLSMAHLLRCCLTDVKQEEIFAALNVKLLHRRVGHIGKGGMDRLA